MTDEETIKTWKAEAMRSIAAHPRYVLDRAQRIQDIVYDIEAIFVPLLSMSGPVQWDKDACVAMVEMAVSFKTLIDYSPKTYLLEVDFAPPYTKSNRVLLAKDFHNFTTVDVETDQVVRSQDRLQKDHRGRIGVKLCTIYPALHRHDGDNGEKMVLVKPAMLAELYKRDRAGRHE